MVLYLHVAPGGSCCINMHLSKEFVMRNPIKRKGYVSRLALAVAMVLSCASGAAAILEWMSDANGIPADILVLRDAELGQVDLTPPLP
jgi:hypothetical protein